MNSLSPCRNLGGVAFSYLRNSALREAMVEQYFPRCFSLYDAPNLRLREEEYVRGLVKYTLLYELRP